MQKFLFGFCVVFAWMIVPVERLSALSQEHERDEKQTETIAGRFLSILEKNPQRGTALDKVFAYHLQRGSLDGFITELENRTKANANDDVAWMLLGLLESQRRGDQKAIAALEVAEKLRDKDPLPAYYRGQCLLRIGEPDRAIQAFELAITRKPNRVVLLELFELLGKTHQRQGRNDLALDCWRRLEDMFPDDLRVLEQIASTQTQEGDFQDALTRYEKLIRLSKDAYKRTQFRIEATQLRIQLGDSLRALTDLEGILADLKPDGWLYRDVQRKIEDVYLKQSDQSGLVTYYETRLGKFPDELESMVRLAKFLTLSNRVDEANDWMKKAIELAPSRIDLRRLFIDQLLADQQIAAAIEQYRHLSELDPKNNDILREWGKLVLRDPSRTSDESKAEASAIWQRILTSRSDEALTHIQVADLFQSAQMPDEAQKQFERAIELAPDEAQYREYYGDFLFKQDKVDEAFAAWDAIAEGARRNAFSVMRLAEVYHHAKQNHKAAKLAKEACSLAPNDPQFFMRTARLQSFAEQFEEATESLAAAEKIAENDDQREYVIQERMNVLEKGNRLHSEADSLQVQLQRVPSAPFAQRQLLVRYLVRLRRWREAKIAVDQALASDSNNLTMLVAASEISEGLGDVAQTIELLRKLADVDRRRRQDYLERISRLQARKKNWADAIETAKEVVLTMPSKIEGYEFLAQVCFQAKNYTLGIETLRKALRIDPNSQRVVVALGTALAERKNYDEAIELVWQSFAKSNSLDEKLDLTTKLASLYRQKGSANKLFSKAEPQSALSPLADRFQEIRRDAAQRRDCSICLAQVYQSIPDYANAKSTLEELLTDRSRDTILLQQLVNLCVKTEQLDLAIDYQQQLVSLAPGQENESVLANLLRKRGDWNEANSIVMKLLLNERDPIAILQNIDSLLQQGDHELALKSLESLVRKEPNHWELLYRKGVAHTGIDQWGQARDTFELILSLENDRKEKGFTRSTAGAKKRPVANQPILSQVAMNQPSTSLSDIEEMERSEYADIASGRARFVGGSAANNTRGKWKPELFGEVRLACIAWLVCCESKDPAMRSAWLAKTLERAKQDAARDVLMDAMAIARFRLDTEAQIAMLATMALRGEADIQGSFLQCLRRRSVSGNPTENKKRKPLAGSQNDLLLASYDAVDSEPILAHQANMSVGATVSSQSASLLQRSALQQQAASQSMQMTVPQKKRALQSIQMSLPQQQNALQNQTPHQFQQQMAAQHQMVALAAMTQTRPNKVVLPAKSKRARSEGYVRTVVNELRFAGEADRAEAFLKGQIETAQTEFKLRSLCEYLFSCERFEEMEGPLLRWFEIYQKGIEDGSRLSLREDVTPTEFAARYLNTIKEKTSPSLALQILDLAVSIANEQFRKRELSPLTSSSLTATPEAMTSIGPSKQPIQMPVWVNHFVSDDLFYLFDSVKTQCGRENRREEWDNYLKQRLLNADADTKPLERLRQALLSTAPAKLDGTNMELVGSLEELGQKPECALHSAASLLALKRYDTSRKLAQSFIAADPQEELLREIIVLQASAALSDRTQLETSMKFINGQNLDSAAMSSILSSLQSANALHLLHQSPTSQYPTRSSTNVISNILAGRSAVRTSPTSSGLAGTNTTEYARIKDLMEAQNSGQIEAAIRIAKQIVSKPRVFPPLEVLRQPPLLRNWSVTRSTIPLSRSTSKTTMVASPPETRDFAFHFLKERGAMKDLIEETNKLLADAPDSFKQLELLAEYYEINGDTKLSIETTLRALRLRPSSSPLRMYFAERLSALGDSSAACDQHLELIRHDPNNGLLSVSKSLADFNASDRMEDLRKAVLAANFHSIVDREYLLTQAIGMLENTKHFEVGLALLEKLSDLDPSLRQQSLRMVYRTLNPANPAFLPFAIAGFIPNENDVAMDPWVGLEDESTFFGDDQSTYLLEWVLRNHSQEDIAKSLAPAIEEAVDRMPGWYAGSVFLAMIAEHIDSPENAQKRIGALASDRRLLEDCPDGVALCVAKMFLPYPEYRPISFRLIEPLVGSARFMHLAVSQRPVMILAKYWIASGERAKALEIITKEYDAGGYGGGYGGGGYRVGGYGGMYGGMYVGYGPPPNPPLGTIFLDLGLPVDSYRAFNFHMENVRNANPNFIANQEAGKKAALKAFEKLLPLRAIEECILDRTNLSAKMPALELMLRVPRVQNIAGQSIESELQKTMVGLAKQSRRQVIEEGLLKLARLHPDDITIPATLARIRLACGTEDAMASLSEIDRILTAKFSYFTNAGTAASSTLQSTGIETSYSIASLWLVARDCYASGQHLDDAERLASHALLGAKAVDDIGWLSANHLPGSVTYANETLLQAELENIMLFEWGMSQFQAGLVDKGAATWSRLIENVCTSNQRLPSSTQTSKPTPSNEKMGTWKKRQSDWLIFLGNEAFDQNQIELATKIVKKFAEKRFAIVNGNRESTENTMKPMVRSVLALIERLRAAGLTASDRYECLLPLFLQDENHAFLFTEQALLLNEQPVFLASRLIESAVESGRSSDLRSRLEKREATENKLTLLVFRTQLAMQEKDLSEAKKLLGGFCELFHEETPFSDFEMACHAAIPAFEIEELRDAALPILEAYVERVKTRKYYPESDLQFFRLVQEMNKHVENKKR